MSCFEPANIKTPNIDKLAAKGVLFSRAFAHNVITLPSHVNILTGTYPYYHGVRDNSGFRLSEESLLISEVLKDQGYSTAAFIGAFPLDDRFGLNQGFDLYDDYYGNTAQVNEMLYVERRAEEVLAAAMKWIEDQGQNPWFCWIHLFDPHAPYLPPSSYKAQHPSNPYADEVAYTDQELGKLFRFFEQREDRSFPLTIITSDHGESLGEHGELTHGVFAYNSTLHIPLIIYQPEIFPEAKQISLTVGHIDIVPTILDVLDIDIPDVIQGRSLLPLLENPEGAKNKPLYFESLSPQINRNWAPLYGLVDGDDKYISLPLPEFYDISRDFKEEKNLVSSELVVIKNLQEELDVFLSSAQDPTSSRQPVDPETLEKLRSLGYVSASRSAPAKKAYTAEDDPKNLITLDRKMHQGIIAYQRGELDKAQGLFEEILVKKPGYILIYEHLSYIYREQGQLDKALALLEQASDRGIKDPAIQGKLGGYYQEAGNLEKARSLLEDVVKDFPYDVETLNFLGITYWKMQFYPLAINTFTKALEIDKGYARVYNNLASVYLSQKDYAQAEKQLKNALHYDANLASAYNGLGVVRGSQNNLPQAVEYWKKAVELDKTQFDALYNLCIALTRLDQFEDALKYIGQFVATAPPQRYTKEIENMKKLQTRLKDSIKQ